MFQVGQFLLQAFDFAKIVFADDQYTAVGVLHHVQVSVSAVARIERNAHEIGDRAGLEKIRRLDAVVFQNGDPIAASEAETE